MEMQTAQLRSIGHTVARYLLFALLGLLIVDLVIGVDSIVSLLSLAGVTSLLFLGLAVDSVLNGTESPSAGRVPGAWSWLGENRWETAVLVGLVVVGVALRVYALGVQSFWFDEAITTNAAIAFLETGRPTFPSGYTYWRAFTHTVVVSASMFVFGTSEWGARFPSVIFGGLSIIATYWLGREVGGSRVGLLGAGLITFATWEIAWSRQARMYQLFQLLYTLSVVVLLRVEAAGFQDRRLLSVLVIVVGLAAATHPVGYVLLPVTVVFLSMTAVFDGAVSRQTAGVIIGVTVVLTILFEMVGPGITGALERITATDVEYWDAYVSWLSSELHAFLYLAIVGVGVTVYAQDRRAGLLCLLAVLPPVVILSFSTQLFATRYLYFALPFIFVWATVAVAFIIEQLRGLQSVVSPLRTMRSQQFISVVSIGLLCMLMLGGGFTVAPQQEYQLGVNAPQPDFKSAYEYVNEHRDGDDVIVAGWTAPGVYYAGEVDYWLAHDLTGTGGTYTINGVDRYGGAEPIRSVDELRTVVNRSDQIWIVVERIVELRQSSETQEFLSTEMKTEYNQNRISVYRSS